MIQYTSRSAMETYARCPQKFLLEYAYLGTGIRPKSTSIPLTSGTAVHAGVGKLLQFLRDGVEITGEKLAEGIQAGRDKYEEIVKYKFKGVKGEYGQEYTYLEQSNLTAGLVLLWALTEMRDLQESYTVVEVEKEECFPLVFSLEDNQIMVESRADAILKSKNAKNDYVVYSLKTAKRWYRNQRENFKHDLQGISEHYAVKERFKKEDRYKKFLIEDAEIAGLSNKHIEALKKIVDATIGKNVVGVRYCVLVKGDYKEPFENAGFKCTQNPIVRGYKKIDIEGKKYAHSYYFPNPNNKSGRGSIGSTYKPFNVWEEFSIEEWVADCFTGKIQPEAKQELLDLVVTMEVYRNSQDIMRTVKEMHRYAQGMYFPIIGLDKKDICVEKLDEDWMCENYPRYRHSCHYPTDCEFVDFCHNGRVPEIGDEWEPREPHHVKELESRGDEMDG